jgi:DNA-binding NarL/FixJ family response regulator
MMIQLTNEKFDLLILDAQFPDGISVTYIHEIKLLQPQIKILVFTSFAEEHFSLKFINAGANGFLNKLSEEQSIKLAIQNVMEQGRHYSSFTEKLLDLSKFNPLLLNPVHHLSERELEIAKLLVNGYGNLEIANTLNIKQNTVSTFKKRIFEKLNINSIIDLIEIIKMI